MLLAEILFAAGVAVAAWFDLRQRRVPNGLNLALLLSGLGVRAAAGGLSPVGDGLLGAALGLGLLFAPFAARWIGAGDVKLAAAMGAWLGPIGIFWAVLFGLVGGGMIAAVYTIAGGAELRADVARNLKNAVLSLSGPDAPRRTKSLLVPLALPLAVAAVGVIVSMGGLHV